MKDTIYRQEAIDAICKVCSMEEDYHKCDGYPEISTWCDNLVALRALPSAQPEIILCKDCKYYHADVKMCEGWIKQHVFLVVNENMWCCAGERL